TASAPDATREMRDLLDTLPVAAGSGTLVDRFTGPAAAGAGWVRAKTGTLAGTSTLAGSVTSTDGRTMSFALLSSGTDPAVARPVLDRIAAEISACGCR
ncbi:MAG: D-alanyl-D-alanine carboxypeptidase, partial [Dietzia maris]